MVSGALAAGGGGDLGPARPPLGRGGARRAGPAQPTQLRKMKRTGGDGHAGHEVVADGPEEGLELERVGGEAVDAERGRDGQGEEGDPLDVVEQGGERDGREDRLLVERRLDIVVWDPEVDRLAGRLGLGQGRDERVWVASGQEEGKDQDPIQPEVATSLVATGSIPLPAAAHKKKTYLRAQSPSGGARAVARWVRSSGACPGVACAGGPAGRPLRTWRAGGLGRGVGASERKRRAETEGEVSGGCREGGRESERTCLPEGGGLLLKERVVDRWEGGRRRREGGLSVLSEGLALPFGWGAAARAPVDRPAQRRPPARPAPAPTDSMSDPPADPAPQRRRPR